MKKWLGYLLSFYILFCAVVPCTVLDNCESKPNTQQTKQQQGNRDCNNCLPFSICSSGHGFTISTAGVAIEPAASCCSPAYSNDYFVALSAYSSSLFQPPRAG